TNALIISSLLQKNCCQCSVRGTSISSAKVSHPSWPSGDAFGVTQKKPPAVSRGLLLVQQGYCLPADLEAGSATGTGGLAAKYVTAGDKLDPKRTVALVVRGGGGLPKRIQAVLRRTRGCGGESRQLEHHPRTGIEFRHAEGQGRPFGGYLELTACS